MKQTENRQLKTLLGLSAAFFTLALISKMSYYIIRIAFHLLLFFFPSSSSPILFSYFFHSSSPLSVPFSSSSIPHFLHVITSFVFTIIFFSYFFVIFLFHYLRTLSSSVSLVIVLVNYPSHFSI